MEQPSDIAIQVRKACRQFAMLYYHFCKALYETQGEAQALQTVQRALFSLGTDRAQAMRAAALERGVPLTVDGFAQVSDLPAHGWGTVPGEASCPYAHTWLQYIDDSPWFRAFASLYCDVVDTTNIEVFTGDTTHRITKNLLWGDSRCEREYARSDDVKAGARTYRPE